MLWNELCYFLYLYVYYVLHINPKWTMNVKRNKLEMTINEQVSKSLGKGGHVTGYAAMRHGPSTLTLRFGSAGLLTTNDRANRQRVTLIGSQEAR